MVVNSSTDGCRELNRSQRENLACRCMITPYWACAAHKPCELSIYKMNTRNTKHVNVKDKDLLSYCILPANQKFTIQIHGQHKHKTGLFYLNQQPILKKARSVSVYFQLSTKQIIITIQPHTTEVIASNSCNFLFIQQKSIQ